MGRKLPNLRNIVANERDQDVYRNSEPPPALDDPQNPTPQETPPPFSELSTTLALPQDTVTTIASWPGRKSLPAREVRPALKRIADAIKTVDGSERWKTSVDSFVNGSLAIWPLLKSKKAKKEIEGMVHAFISHEKDVNRAHAAELFILWKEGMHEFQRSGDLSAKEKVPVAELIKPIQYLPDFLHFIEPSEFDDFGRLLQVALDKSNNKALDIKQLFEFAGDSVKPGIDSFPPLLLEKMAQCFVEAGLIHISNGKLKLLSRADEKTLTYQYLTQVHQAVKRLEVPPSNGRHNEIITTSEDITRVYSDYNRSKKMNEIPIRIEGRSQRVLTIAGIGLGHQDTARDFIIRVIETVRKLPDDKKPHLIVINNLLSGAFENRNKGQKAALVPELETLEDQFKAGRALLNEIQSIGVPVVLNLGSADWEIARDVVLRILRHERELVGHIPYYKQDQLQRDEKKWSIYDAFVVEVVVPYCLRKGELPPASELLRLFDVYQELQNAQKEGRNPDIAEEYRNSIDITLIPFNEKMDFGDQLFITDDAELNLGGDVYKQKETIYSDFNFSTSAQPPLYGAPIEKLRQRVIQGLAAGTIEPGSSYTLENQHEFLAVQVGDNTWVKSEPAARLDEFATTRGIRKRAADASRRQAATRGRQGSEGIISVETSPEGRTFTVYTPYLLDRAESAERTTYLIEGDGQEGSVTERTDSRIKAYDIWGEIMKRNKVKVVHPGDQLHGRNYKEKANQESGVGMQIKIDDQAKLYNILLELAFAHVSPEHIQNIEEVQAFPGNHELNSGFGQYGITHTQPTVDTWNKILQEKGSHVRARLAENVVTGDGSFYTGWIAVSTTGGYRWLFQHYPLKNGGKGMGPLPIYQTWRLLDSLNELGADISGYHFQHYHQSSIHMVAGGKIATIGPSKAGQSEFEHYLGHRSVPGMMMIHLGGNEAPAFEFLSRRALLNHKINRDSMFSEERLNDLGFFTDEGFNPLRDGFIPWVKPFDVEDIKQGRIPTAHPQSALQKFIWRLAVSLPLQAHTTIG